MDYKSAATRRRSRLQVRSITRTHVRTLCLSNGNGVFTGSCCLPFRSSPSFFSLSGTQPQSRGSRFAVRSRGVGRGARAVANNKVRALPPRREGSGCSIDRARQIVRAARLVSTFAFSLVDRLLGAVRNRAPNQHLLSSH